MQDDVGLDNYNNSKRYIEEALTAERERIFNEIRKVAENVYRPSKPPYALIYVHTLAEICKVVKWGRVK
jgi:hypothetical protein